VALVIAQAETAAEDGTAPVDLERRGAD
jgi:hypothetical protein